VTVLLFLDNMSKPGGFVGVAAGSQSKARGMDEIKTGFQIMKSVLFGDNLHFMLP